MTEQKLFSQLDQLEKEATQPLRIYRKALLKDFHEDQEHEGTLAMKVLSIFGAFFATVFFLGFLFLLGLDSPVAFGFIGGLMLVGGYVFCRRDFLGVMGEAFGVALVVCGFPLFLFGFVDAIDNESGMALLAFLLAATVLLLMENSIVTFLATVTMGCCLLFLAHDGFDRFGAHLYVGFTAILLTGWVHFEAWALKSSDLVCRRYDGIRIGLIVALLIGAGYLSDFRFWNSLPRLPNWYASVVLVPLIFWMVWQLLLQLWGEDTEFIQRTQDTEFTQSTQNTELTQSTQSFGVEPGKHLNLWLYLAGLLVLMLPTIFAPALSATLLCLLLSWRAGYKTGTGLAVMALIYFISRYYYDLNLSLLNKSIILSASGGLFLLAWWVLRKKISPDEANV